MAITITSQPSGIAFSKNIIKYVVNTDAGLRVRARLFLEEVAYSDAYVFIVELEAIPDSTGNCTFYFHNIIDDNIDYHEPSFFADQESAQVSRRFKVDFYEYDAADLVLHEEVYSEAGGYVDIKPIDNTLNYVIIQERTNWEFIIFRLGGNIQNALNAYLLQDEFWGSINPSFDFGEVSIPAKTKVSIFIGDLPTLLSSNVVSVLKGGESLLNTFIELTPPSHLTLVGFTDTQINLSWSLSFSSYQTEIYISTDGGATFSLLATKAAGITTHEATALTTGDTYSFRVRAKLGDNVSIYSEVVSFELVQWAFETGVWLDTGMNYDNELIAE